MNNRVKEIEQQRERQIKESLLEKVIENQDFIIYRETYIKHDQNGNIEKLSYGYTSNYHWTNSIANVNYGSKSILNEEKSLTFNLGSGGTIDGVSDVLIAKAIRAIMDLVVNDMVKIEQLMNIKKNQEISNKNLDRTEFLEYLYS